jgi:hypothetical protein
VLRRVVAVFLVLFTLAGTARANGRFPASSAIVLSPGDTMLVRATFGLLVSRDRGATFGFVCERAVGFMGIEDPTYVITPSGAFVASTFEGVSVSRDRGCEWSFAGGPSKWIFIDLAMQADGTLWGIKSIYEKTTDAGIRYDNALFVSHDDAASFTQVSGAIDPSLLLEAVEVAPSDPKRIYVSGLRGEGPDRKGVLLVSRDEGKKLEEHIVPLISGERAPFIAAVDPKKADRVYVRTAGDPSGPSRLLVTDDAGKTFHVAHESKTPLVGFALSPDGAEVVTGGRDGLFFSKTDAFAFEKKSLIEVQCLAWGDGDTTWACSNEKSGFFAAASPDHGAAFPKKIHLDDLKGTLACAETTTVGKLCTPEWARVRRELGLSEPDAGAPPAVPPPPPASRWWMWALVASLVALAAMLAFMRHLRRGSSTR